MSGHSILYLGRGEFAADYLGELETLPCCTYLTRSSTFELPEDASYIVDLVLLEAGPAIVESGHTLKHRADSVASAVPGRRTYTDASMRTEASPPYARAQWAISASTTLRSKNRKAFSITPCSADACRHGYPAPTSRCCRYSRTSMTALSSSTRRACARHQPGRAFDSRPGAAHASGPCHGSRPFAASTRTARAYKNSADLPLVRARSGEKFSNQVAIYREPEQPDVVLSINGQGLYDGRRELVGGVITFRDMTEATEARPRSLRSATRSSMNSPDSRTAACSSSS